jgi:hypothetical protein
VGDVFGADDALLAGGFHRGAAEAGEGGSGIAAVEFGDDLGAVMVAGGFAGGEEDARVGDNVDESSLEPAQDVLASNLLVGGDCPQNVGQSSDPNWLVCGDRNSVMRGRIGVEDDVAA